MILSPTDISDWAEATGSPYPATAAEKAAALPQILAWKQQQLEQQQDSRGPSALDITAGVAALGGIGALVFRLGKHSGKSDAEALQAAAQAEKAVARAAAQPTNPAAQAPAPVPQAPAAPAPAPAASVAPPVAVATPPAVPAPASAAQRAFEIVSNRGNFDVLGMRERGQTMATAKAPGDPGWLGNPFVASDANGPYTRQEATEKFAELIRQKAQDPQWREAFLNLEGKRIGYYKPDEEFIHLNALRDWIQQERAASASAAPPAAPPAAAAAVAQVPSADDWIAASTSPIPKSVPILTGASRKGFTRDRAAGLYGIKDALNQDSTSDLISAAVAQGKPGIVDLLRRLDASDPKQADAIAAIAARLRGGFAPIAKTVKTLDKLPRRADEGAIVRVQPDPSKSGHTFVRQGDQWIPADPRSVAAGLSSGLVRSPDVPSARIPAGGISNEEFFGSATNDERLKAGQPQFPTTRRTKGSVFQGRNQADVAVYDGGDPRFDRVRIYDAELDRDRYPDLENPADRRAVIQALDLDRQENIKHLRASEKTPGENAARILAVERSLGSFTQSNVATPRNEVVVDDFGTPITLFDKEGKRRLPDLNKPQDRDKVSLALLKARRKRGVPKPTGEILERNLRQQENLNNVTLESETPVMADLQEGLPQTRRDPKSVRLAEPGDWVPQPITLRYGTDANGHPIERTFNQWVWDPNATNSAVYTGRTAREALQLQPSPQHDYSKTLADSTAFEQLPFILKEPGAKTQAVAARQLINEVQRAQAVRQQNNLPPLNRADVDAIAQRIALDFGVNAGSRQLPGIGASEIHAAAGRMLQPAAQAEPAVVRTKEQRLLGGRSDPANPSALAVGSPGNPAAGWPERVVAAMGHVPAEDLADVQRFVTAGNAEEKARAAASYLSANPGVAALLGNLRGVPILERFSLVQEAITAAAHDYSAAISSAQSRRPDLAAKAGLAGEGHVSFGQFAHNYVRPYVALRVAELKNGTGEAITFNVPKDATQLLGEQALRNGTSLVDAVTAQIKTARSPLEGAIQLDRMVAAAQGTEVGREPHTNASLLAWDFYDNAGPDTMLGQLKERAASGVVIGDRKMGATMPVRLNFGADLPESRSTFNPNDGQALDDIRQRVLTGGATVVTPAAEGLVPQGGLTAAVNQRRNQDPNTPRNWKLNQALSAQFTNSLNQARDANARLSEIKRAEAAGDLEPEVAVAERTAQLARLQQARDAQRQIVGTQAIIDAGRRRIENMALEANSNGLVLDYDDSGQLSTFLGDPHRPALSLSGGDEKEDQPLVGLDRQQEWARDERLVPQAADAGSTDVGFIPPSARSRVMVDGLAGPAWMNAPTGTARMTVGADGRVQRTDRDSQRAEREVLAAGHNLEKLRQYNAGTWEPREMPHAELEQVPVHNRSESQQAAQSYLDYVSRRWQGQQPKAASIPAVAPGAARPYSPAQVEPAVTAPLAAFLANPDPAANRPRNAVFQPPSSTVTTTTPRPAPAADVDATAARAAIVGEYWDKLAGGGMRTSKDGSKLIFANQSQVKPFVEPSEAYLAARVKKLRGDLASGLRR